MIEDDISVIYCINVIIIYILCGWSKEEEREEFRWNTGVEEDSCCCTLVITFILFKQVFWGGQMAGYRIGMKIQLARAVDWFI